MAETGRQGIEEAEPPLSCQVNDERRIGGTTFCRYTKLMQKPQELPDRGFFFTAQNLRLRSWDTRAEKGTCVTAQDPRAGLAPVKYRNILTCDLYLLWSLQLRDWKGGENEDSINNRRK